VTKASQGRAPVGGGIVHAGVMTSSLRSAALLVATAVVLTGCTGAEGEEPEAQSGAQPEVTQSYEDSVVQPGAVLEVPDQTREGRNLRVEQVRATDGGWVVVATADGRHTLGVGEVPAGEQPQEILVGLAEDVEPGEHDLVAHLYTDDGDNEFNESDQPLAAEAGQEDELGFPGESARFTLTLELDE
jgi:hypothetical protein